MFVARSLIDTDYTVFAYRNNNNRVLKSARYFEIGGRVGWIVSQYNTVYDIILKINILLFYFLMVQLDNVATRQ